MIERVKTNTQYKVGDKVYVHPCIGEESSFFKYYIRATITDLDERFGYLLRAFKEDLPGIYMFNIWDVDLLPRSDKSNKLLPPEDRCSDD